MFRVNLWSRLWVSIRISLISSVFQFVEALWVIWIYSFFGKYLPKKIVLYEVRISGWPKAPPQNKWSPIDSRNIEDWPLHEHLSEIIHVYPNNSLLPAESSTIEFDAGRVACRTGYRLVTFRCTGFVSRTVATSRYAVVLLRTSLSGYPFLITCRRTSNDFSAK